MRDEQKGNAKMFEIGEFKGNPTISLKENENSETSFTFGLRKARLIIDNFTAIQEFVEDHQVLKNSKKS